MHQLTIWLGASVVLVAGIVALAFRIQRGFDARLERERREAQRMSEVHLATIEALALAIDAKDQTSHNHIRRVQSYATGIARAIGLPEEAIQAIRTAAVLHDIGQLAVPEHILAKPGPLTPEEFQKVRIHPQVGAGIVGSVPFPYPVTPLILSHHERWDGSGYPNGAKGEEIPLGARVLGLVDYFDSLTSDRPYHRAMSDDEALTLLEFLPQPSAKIVWKTVKSAAANAENNYQLDVDSLRVKAAYANEGTRLHRFRAGPRGRAKPWTRRYAHITIVVEDRV